MLALDFIKLMPPGDYATIDWGGTSEYQGAAGGTRQTTRFPITGPDDWAGIKPVPADRGFNAQVVRACSLTRDAVGADVPVLQTIFSPLTIASKMSDGKVVDHLRSHPDVVHAALQAIRDVTIAVSRASLQAGATGVFFASQLATSDLLTESEYLDFGTNYDLEVLEETVDAGSEFTMIHLHGKNTFFHILAGYPGNALNWHDRAIGPDLASVQSNYPDCCVVGGVNEKAIATMSPDAVREDVREAREATNDLRLMIGPGCVIPIATPEANLLAAVEEAKRT
jgi:uroporphyrinogen decarboxylase